MVEFVNLLGSLRNGFPSMDKFMNVFSKIGGGADALATMIINTQNSLQNDISGQISKMTDEITKLAVANSTYVTTKAIGKDVTGMPSAESIIKSINLRMQTELKDILERANRAILRPLAIGPPIVNTSGASGGGFRRANTLKNLSVTHRNKTHRRSAVVSKSLSNV